MKKQSPKPYHDFKVGDQVYCPTLSNSIHTIKANGNNIFVNSALACVVLGENGFPRGAGAFPVVFHATPENQVRLEQLYDAEFQDAPKPPTPEELLIKHFSNGGCTVLCRVWDCEPNGLITRLVVGFDEKRGKFKVHGTNITWNHAIPLQESGLTDDLGLLKYVDSIVDLDV